MSFTRGLLGIVVTAAVAHASPAAEKLFQDGRKLLKAGKLAEACDAFRRSNEIERRAGTLLNLGDCEERRGRLATAWEAFIAARARAEQDSDRRKARAADERARALATKLPYVTLRSPASPRPAGFVVKRDGIEVPLAELDHEVPLDPGQYELEVSAPGHVAWKHPLTVAAGEKVIVAIPPLAPEPGAQPAAAPAVATATPAPTPAAPLQPVDTIAPAPLTDVKTRFGIGAAVGVSTDGDPIYGVRVPLQLATVGTTGSVRVVASGFYSAFPGSAGQDQEIRIYMLGLAGEYVAALAPRVRVAAGIGLGVDLIDDSYQNYDEERGWGAARLSPTYRIGRAVDVGIHVQAVFTSDDVAGLGGVGVDYFFW